MSVYWLALPSAVLAVADAIPGVREPLEAGRLGDVPMLGLLAVTLAVVLMMLALLHLLLGLRHSLRAVRSPRPSTAR